MIFDIGRYNVGGGGDELFLKNDIATMTRTLLCYGAPSFDFGFAIRQLWIPQDFVAGSAG